jgi:hypothetical protein
VLNGALEAYARVGNVLNTFFANLVNFAAPMLDSLLDRWLDIRVVFFIVGGVHLVAALLFRLLGVAVDQFSV